MHNNKEEKPNGKIYNFFWRDTNIHIRFNLAKKTANISAFTVLAKQEATNHIAMNR